MKILILDLYNYPRDLAQMDMYTLFKENFEVTFANSKNILDLVYDNDYDCLYLGILHRWCNIPWKILFDINKKPILIDQADNDGFISRSDKITYKGDCMLLSRYLPDENLNKSWNGKIELLPWYIDPKRFKPKNKKIDVSFIYMKNHKRLGANRDQISEKVQKHCNKNKLSYKIGEYWDNEYQNIVTSSKALVVDGSRFCLTQKYIEASLSNCLIVGEKPLKPTNEIKTINLESVNSKNIDNFNDIITYNREYILETFANKNVFIEKFKNILKKI